MITGLDRRNFLQLLSAFSLMTCKGAFAQEGAAPARPKVKNRKNFVGIQVRGFSWVDEGVDQVLDNLQQKGDVNTVWAYTFPMARRASAKMARFLCPIMASLVTR